MNYEREQTEVVVVGGGPVGMLLAGDLAQQGVKVLLLERLEEISTRPKAGTFHTRTVATLARRGLLRLQPDSSSDYNVMDYQPFHFAGYPWLEVRGHSVEGPITLGLGQSDLEQVLEKRALTQGADIRRGVTVTEILQDEKAVKVRYTTAQEEHAVSAEYGVGCDGARSLVRSSGFSVTDYPPTTWSVTCWAVVGNPRQLPPGWNTHPRGVTMVNLNPYGHSRISVFEFDGPASERRSPLSVQEFSQSLDRVLGQHIELSGVQYLDRLSDFIRIADSYRSGRLFLAGDAAHVHPPLGGQGLNTGLQDAVNLAFKIVSVIAYGADPSLLDSYDAERRPVGEAVVDNSRVQALLMNPAAEFSPMRSFFKRMLRETDVHDWLSDQISGHGLHYPTLHTTDPNIHEGRAGEFLPNITFSVSDGEISVAEALSDGKALLIVSAGTAITAQAVLEKVTHPRLRVLIPDEIPDGLPQAILVRPDGYIAWASSHLDNGVVTATHTWLGGSVR